MKIAETGISGLLVIGPNILKDNRGYFFESYNLDTFKNNGIDCNFVQDNQSKSSFGVIRGLHYQLEPFSQTKLVRVLDGEIYDVAVDIRKGSPTFGKWFGVTLNSINYKQFLIPRGFAHGFSVLSDTAVILYKCDNVYNKGAERGIAYNDVNLGIDWKVKQENILLSERDLLFPELRLAEMNFEF